jgi:hypothetical protein
MPGAQPSANPAQRSEFEERCRQLHQNDEHDQVQDRSVRILANSSPDDCHFEKMFPNLDAALVRTIVSESPSVQHALDTLTALAVAVAECSIGNPIARLPQIEIENTEMFPVLVDSDGWQVGSQQLFDRGTDEDLGTAWCDLAKTVSSLPIPKQCTTPSSLAARARREQQQQRHLSGKGQSQISAETAETDYEFRQRKGEERAQNRVRFGHRTNRRHQSTSQAHDNLSVRLDSLCTTDDEMD